MSRLLANCSTTTTSSSSGSVTTICDCDCEGCCCQHLTFSAHSGDLWVDFTWSAPSTDGLLPCVGLLDSYIDHVDAWLDYCPPYPDDGNVPADFRVFTPAPVVIPAAYEADCVTLIFYDGNGNERTRCTAKLTL